MWEEWHASDVMQCRAHPAHCWLSPCQHHPMADIVCGSRVRCSAGKGPEPPAPKSGWTLCADVLSLGGCTLWLLVGCPLMWMSKQVAAMAPGPCSLLPSCPSMVSMTKLFHVPLNRRGGEGGEGVWRDAEMVESQFSVVWVATSPPVRLWITHFGVMGSEWCKQQNQGGNKCCLRAVKIQRDEALAWKNVFIHSTGHDDPW